MLAFRPLSTLSLVSVLLTGTFATAIPGSVSTWKDWTCPPPSTSLLSFTQTEYVPVTTTETNTQTTAITEIRTQTVTLYQTIISTKIQTTTETTPTTEFVTTPTTIYHFENITLTETTPTTATEVQTVVTTSPLTLTATEDVQIYSSTTRLTSLVLCPTRIVNPTFTVQAPLPSDWTWGCPPGWLCKPKQIDCDFEVGLPDRGFYCAPNECMPAEALPQPLPNWNTDPSGNFSPADNPGLTVNAIDSYFNMNPTNFGLTYDIFVVDEVFTYTSTSIIPPAPSPGVGRRQGIQTVPPACYGWCNNCLLEAQSSGKTPALCRPDSAFQTSLLSCTECMVYHVKDTVETVLLQISPQFQQYMDYCEEIPLIQGSSVTIVATSAGSSSTTVIPTSSVIIVTTTSLPTEPSSIGAPPSSIEVSPISTTVSPTEAMPTSSPAVTPDMSAMGVTTATLPTTITSVGGAYTMDGSDLGQVTIIMPVGLNSTTALSGSELSGATIVIPISGTSVITSSYVTTITGDAAMTSEPSPLASSMGPSPSTFTGTAAIISPHFGSSWLATLLAAMLAVF